jgi:general secretion pathway protein D
MHRGFASVVFLLGSILSADPIVSVGSTSVNVGATFALPVDVAGVSDLYAYQFDVTYNPALLELQSIAEGPFLGTAGPTFFTPGSIDNSVGAATFWANALIGSIPGASGDGEIASLTFRALAAGTSAVSPASVILLDSNGNDIDFTAESGSVTAPIPEPGTAVLVAVALAALAFRRRSHAPWRSPRTSRA